MDKDRCNIIWIKIKIKIKTKTTLASRTVVHPHRQQVGQRGVKVQAHNAALCLEVDLGEGRILNGEAADGARSLPLVVERPVPAHGI